MVTTETRLLEKEQLYRSVLEASADCIKIMTPEGRLKFMNGPGLKLMELPDLDAVATDIGGSSGRTRCGRRRTASSSMRDRGGRCASAVRAGLPAASSNGGTWW